MPYVFWKNKFQHFRYPCAQLQKLKNRTDLLFTDLLGYVAAVKPQGHEQTVIIWVRFLVCDAVVVPFVIEVITEKEY